METKQKISLPLQNEVIRNQILQTLHEFSVLQLHVLKPKNKECTEVFMIIKESKEAEILRARNWIRASATIHKIHLYISSYHQAEFQLKCGNPFYQYYADPATMVWMREDQTAPLKIHPTKKTFKKKLNVFTEKFYHARDILRTEANKFYSHEMYSAALQNYLTLYEHHVEYLENLFTGHNFFDRDLHARLNQLICYLPEIQKVFVKQNLQSFYLISKMEKSLEQYDECFVSSELLDAIKIAETQLYKMVVERFSEFSKITRFKKSALTVTHAEEATDTQGLSLKKVIASLVERLSAEEIYLFHKKESDSQNDALKQAVYYFLIIGDGIGNTPVCDTQQSVYDKSGGKVRIIILGHRRISIQDRLFASQDFMHGIMTPKNRVYASHQFHPPIHWQYSSSDYYGDLPLYYERMTNTVKHYFTARTTFGAENAEIFLLLFSHALMGILRVYLYCSLCSYLPNFNKMFDTWKLCVYSDPALEKIEFLFEKINSDFFKFIDSYLKYTDRPYRFNGDDLIAMDEILNLLLEKLEKKITSKNLAAHIE